MKRALILSVMLSLAGCAPAFAADPAPAEPQDLTIDLASSPSVLVRAPGTYRIHLINRIQRAQYTLSTRIESKNKVAMPLTLPTPKGAVAAVEDCNTNKNAFWNQHDTATSEQKVADLRQTYKSLLPRCTEEEQEGVRQRLELVSQWRDTAALPNLDAGDSLFVTVMRNAADGGVEQKLLGTWQFDFGKQEAQWLTFYGFNFAQSGDENYFTQTNAGTNPPTYTITKSTDRGDNNFSPSIYFFRLPAQQTGFKASRWWGWRGEDTFGGVTAGLGFDFDNPTVFLGYGVGWGYNVMLTAGVVMHKEQRLKGQYDPNDVVAENLTEDQLLDSTYKPRAYVGLAFRFGSNPFGSGGGEAGGEAAKGEEKPK